MLFRAMVLLVLFAPSAAAQIQSYVLVEAIAPVDALVVLEPSVLEIRVTRSCATPAGANPAAQVRLQVKLPSTIAPAGPSSASLPQQVCALEPHQIVYANYTLVAQPQAPGAQAIRGTLQASLPAVLPPVISAPEDTMQDFVVTVEPRFAIAAEPSASTADIGAPGLGLPFALVAVVARLLGRCR